MKCCSRCGQEYPATTDYFYCDRRYGKLITVCKFCRRKQTSSDFRANRAARLLAKKQYYEQHKKEVVFRFNAGKAFVNQRGLEWTLTLDQFADLRKKRCHWCDGELPAAGLGLDRIDNEQGYHIDNVVPCCQSCNENRRLTDHDLYHIQRARRYGKEALYCDLTGKAICRIQILNGVLQADENLERRTP